MNARSRLLAAAAVVPLTIGPMTAPAVAQDEGRGIAAGLRVGLELVADGLVSPVHLSEPDNSGRRFVADQVGLVRIITRDGELLDQPFLDVRERMVELVPFFDERGLLGLAFHPRFDDNGRLFVYYSAPLRPDGPEGFDHTSHIAEFTVSASDPNRVDPDSERIILQVDEPQADHNSGDLHFGPDGYLYISVGDGGGANDTAFGHTPGIGNGQDPTNLLGSLLRIDVDGDHPYRIPPDNPFVGTPARDEIYAYGFRNPYRFTFDRHDLYVADVGQTMFEEVNLVEPGGNYGWNVREATHCFDPDNPTEPPATCPDTGPLFGDPLLDPIIEYGNLSANPEGLGVAVVGGRVYRGNELPHLRGRYVFGDWSSTAFGLPQPTGTLLVAKPKPSGLWKLQELAVAGRPGGELGHFVTGFGQDAEGEVYVLTSDTTGPSGDTGLVYRLTRPVT
jgi:glucose/arabinose dehydrogenase